MKKYEIISNVFYKIYECTYNLDLKYIIFMFNNLVHCYKKSI